MLTSLERGIFGEIEFEIAHRCNMACSYCPNGSLERTEKGEMDLKLFEKVMIELRDAGFKGRVSYHFYNEPLLSKNLEDFVMMTKHYLPKSVPYLFTNGTLLTHRRFKQLVEAGIDFFHVTKHEGVKKDYIFDKTYLDLDPIEKDRVEFDHYTNIELSNRGGLLSHIKHKQNIKEIPCFIPLRLVVVTVKGMVLPCYDDYLQTLEMGNVRADNIIDIWNSPKYIKFRDDLREKGGRKYYKTCENCTNFKID